MAEARMSSDRITTSQDHNEREQVSKDWYQNLELHRVAHRHILGTRLVERAAERHDHRFHAERGSEASAHDSLKLSSGSYSRPARSAVQSTDAGRLTPMSAHQAGTGATRTIC